MGALIGTGTEVNTKVNTGNRIEMSMLVSNQMTSEPTRQKVANQ